MPWRLLEILGLRRLGVRMGNADGSHAMETLTRDECLNCDGTGKLHGVNPCRACKGTGVIPSREPRALDVEVRADTSSGLPGGDSQKAACTLASNPIATVRETVVGPDLFVHGVEVRSWLGTDHNEAAYALAAQINAAAGSAHETSEPPILGAGAGLAPMPTALEAIEMHVRQIQILCDQTGRDPTEWLSDNAAQGETGDRTQLHGSLVRVAMELSGCPAHCSHEFHRLAIASALKIATDALNRTSDKTAGEQP